MKPLNIAVWHNLPSGGGKRALYDQVSGLVRAGHEVEAWCPESANQQFLPLSRLVKENILPFAPGRNLSRPATGPQWLRTWRGLRQTRETAIMMEAHCRQCAEEIRARHFDVLLAAPCQFLRAAPLARFLPDVPTVLYLQEPARDRYEAQPKLPWLKLPDDGVPLFSPRFWRKRAVDQLSLRLLRWLAREELDSAQAYDRILVNSLYSRESLLRAYGLESSVCYLGIDAKHFSVVKREPSPAPARQTIISVGSMLRIKGIDRAIRAVGCIPPEKRPTLLWIGNFGDGNYVRQMDSLAKELGVEFIRREMVSDEELIAALNSATAMLYTPRLEPFGYAPLEANACGVPVVAIAEGGVRETIIDGVNGLLLPGDEPQELAEALGRLLDDPALASRLGEQGRAQVATHWTLASAELRLESFLQKVVSNKAGSAKSVVLQPA